MAAQCLKKDMQAKATTVGMQDQKAAGRDAKDE